MFILRHAFTAAIWLAVLLSCLSVRAQVARELTPPIAQSSTDVPYPAGAEGDALVVLELVVEKDGSVSSATVVEGGEPFAEHARTAALTWHFAPAQHANTPIAARILARVAFHRDEEEAAAPAAPAPSPAGAAAAPEPAIITPPEPPFEITVQGTRREIGQTTLSKADVREMPGAFGDGFRAVEALPGFEDQ